MLKDTMATEYTNVMVVSGDQVDILKKLHMNGFKIENVGTPTADNDAVNKKYVDDNMSVNDKPQAFNITGSSTNSDIGEHTFTLPTTITTSTNFLVSTTLKINFTGTFSIINQLRVIITQLNENNSQLRSTTDNFYVNVDDLGPFKFISGVSKKIITCFPLTKKIKIELSDNYPSGTSKSFNHMLEIERV